MSDFQVADYIILALVLGISLSIGIYHSVVSCVRGKHVTINDYLLGERKLYWLPVGLSILVTFQSAVLFTGVPGEIYAYGFSYVLFHIGMFLSVLVTAVTFLPLLYPLKLTSAYEYLELRFESKITRVIGCLIAMLNMLLYMGVVVFAPAVSLKALSGFSEEGSIVILSIVATIYTAAGGMKAIIWTDVFQFLIMFAGLLAILIEGSMRVGGFANAWEISKEGDRTKTFDVNFDPKVRHSVWTLIIGGTLTWFANIGVNQSNVQRWSSVPSLKAARGALLLSAPGFAIWGVLASMVGIVTYAHYHNIGCDPLVAGRIKNINQVVPLLVGDIFDFLPGFAGLYIASLFSGSLSTVSSGINGLAAMTWEDILKWKLGHLRESTCAWIIKLLVGFYGLVVMAVGFMALRLGGPATQIALKFFGASGGPLVGMFLLGCLFPWSNWIGASVGGVVALALSLWLTIGTYISLPGSSKLPPAPTNSCSLLYDITITTTSAITNSTEQPSILEPFYRVSYLWYGGIGMLTVVILGLIISFITGPTKPSSIRPDLMIPLYDRFCCCLPDNYRKCLRCGVAERDTGDKITEKYAYDNPNMDKDESYVHHVTHL